MARRKAVSRDKTDGETLTIDGVEVRPGQRVDLELKVTRLATGTWVALPVAVLNGHGPGPRLWLSAAVHGDELNGVEIVRRVLPRVRLNELRGAIIAVPIVNVLGFLHQERYLPDRRDLNRSFPGSARGSLAARMAHLLMSEIVDGSDYGIDLHTGSHHRSNLPQIRADLDDPRIQKMAQAFQAPLAIHANSRDGSLRQVAADRGCAVLVYEAGETLRFDRSAIRLGVRGVLRVLGSLKMLGEVPGPEAKKTRFVRETKWVRATRGGILLLEVEPGERVSAQDVLARITDAFSSTEYELKAPFDGIVVGLTTNPLVNRGDAVVHLASVTE